MVYKILKNDGYEPAEIELLQRHAALREQLDATQDTEQKRQLKLKIAEAQQKASMMLEAMRGKR